VIGPRVKREEFVEALVQYHFDGFMFLAGFPNPTRTRFTIPLERIELEVFSTRPDCCEIQLYSLRNPVAAHVGLWSPLLWLQSWLEEYARDMYANLRPHRSLRRQIRGAGVVVKRPSVASLEKAKETLSRTLEEIFVPVPAPNIHSEPLNRLILASVAATRKSSETLFPLANSTYIDSFGKVRIELPYGSQCGDFSDGLAAVYGSEGVEGFIDRTGKIRIAAKFDETLGFSEGYAAVRRGNKWGFIDKSGEFTVPSKFSDLVGFKEGIAAACLDDGDWVLIDTTGIPIGPLRWKTRPKLDGPIIPFSSDNKSWGFADRRGELIVAPIFESVRKFTEGIIAVRLQGKYGFVDFEGKLIIPPHFSDVGFFSEGLAPVCTVDTGDTQGGRWGYINREGEFEIAAQFYAAKDFSEQLAAVVRQDLGEWVYIKKNGETSFVSPEGHQPHSFKSGVAVIGSLKQGLIDRTGKIILRPRFSEIGDFVEGLALVRMRSSDGDIRREGYIDVTGGFVHELVEVEHEDSHERPEPIWSEMNYSDPAGYLNEWGD
jgi:hypothetical protein